MTMSPSVTNPILRTGYVYEVRAPHTRQGTVSGYFDDPEQLHAAAMQHDGHVPALYTTLNPVNPALLARAHNRLATYAKHTTSDADILRREWLLIDCDATRPANISSTDAEHQAALDRAGTIMEWLTSLGWPSPVVADSGNGGHLLYKIDEPNDTDATHTVTSILELLALRFDDPAVVVDRKVFNAARITKLYGSMVCKGDDMPDRPHRRSAILFIPVPLDSVQPECLRGLAAQLPTDPHPRRSMNGAALDLRGFITRHGLTVTKEKPWNGGTVFELDTCPFNAEHVRSSSLIQFPSGAVTFSCLHNSCHELRWTALRARLEPDRSASTPTRVPPEEEHPAAEGSPPGDIDATPDPVVPFTVLTAPTSFISRYVDYASTRTDAPPEAHEALAFGVLSALASTVRLPIATSPRGWSLVLWIIYLVNSTAGRKSTVIDLAIDLVRTILGEGALIFWEGSPQGFIQRLQERDGQAAVFVRDEYSGLIAAFNKNGHLSGLPQVLIKAFDGSVLENIRTRKRGPDGATHSDTDRVETPFLAQFSAAPWDAFVQRATIDNVLDGFLARFIVITGAAAGRQLPLLTMQISSARAALIEHATAYRTRAQAIQQVAIAPGVLAAQWDLEQDFLRRAAASGRPDAAGPALKRLAETALKVAALLALEEETGTVLSIRDEHFVLARHIATRWAGASVRLVEALGASGFQKDCASVLQTITHRPGVSLSLLYRTHKRLRKREFEEILEALELQGRIRSEKLPSMRGRPACLLYPAGGTLV